MASLTLVGLRWQGLQGSDPRSWTQELLEPCTTDELEALARLLGVPHSGTKAVQIARLLNMAALRGELATWGEFNGNADRAHALADTVVPRYKRNDLVGFAKRAGIYYGVNKRGLVIGLLQWRDGCRRRGAEFFDHMKAAPVKQMMMRLD